MTVELEITVHETIPGIYSLALALNVAGDQAKQRKEYRPAERDLEKQLDDARTDPVLYGLILGRFLLGPEILRENNPDGVADTSAKFWAGAQARAHLAGEPLRVRLVLGAQIAPKMHAWRWELLRDPAAAGNPLVFTGDWLLFSRHLSSEDYLPPRYTKREHRRALAVIASPKYLEQPGSPLVPFEVAAQIELIKSSLCGTEQSVCRPENVKFLASDAGISGERLTLPTLDALLSELRTPYDILYILCHGELNENEDPILHLEPTAGPPSKRGALGYKLVDAIKKASCRPMLVVLASCLSGADGSRYHDDAERALTALGPRLAEAGVLAVVAMHGNVRIKTLTEFVPRLFQSLDDCGDVERAVAVARDAIKQDDFWMPVLYTRLHGDHLWTTTRREPTSVEARQVKRIQDAMSTEYGCVPIIGPNLSDFLLGSRREIARRWADEHEFPLAPHQRNDLPQVAQYLSTMNSPEFPRVEFSDYLVQRLVDQYRPHLPPTLLRKVAQRVPLSLPRLALLQELLSVIVPAWRGKEQDSFTYLANLPFKIYLTTDPSDLLENALVAAGRKPLVLCCQWAREVTQDALEKKRGYEENFQPSPHEPLVFHLFGRLDEPDSLVLTEDHFFDYLIALARRKWLLPLALRTVFAQCGLLFVGFYIDDWDFRIIMRSIFNVEGFAGNKENAAVQVDPEAGSLINAEAAREYMKKYFGDKKIPIFWGGHEMFLRALWQRWNGVGIPDMTKPVEVAT